MDISAQNGDADTVFLGKVLQPMHEHLSFLLVLVGGVMVVQIVQKIDASIKLVEHASGNTKALVQELDRSYDR